jgi:hypothetical protein
VVQHYDPEYSPEGVSAFLANEELKKRYEKVHRDIGDAKKNLDKKLRSVAGYGEKSRENVEVIIERVFKNQYYEALLNIETEIDSTQNDIVGEADHQKIFNPKVSQFLDEQSTKDSVAEFAQKYDELTQSSPILRNEFQYHNIQQVQQQLESNKFFVAGHTINLSDKTDGQKIALDSDASLRQKIQEEKQRVLSDATLQKKFDSFQAKLKNKELEAFRDYIAQNQHLLPELQDTVAFERKLWIQYVYRAKQEYDLLLTEYRKGQVELKQIIDEASGDKNDWDAVIDEFNRRFLHLPFSLSVENKSDVILKDSAPSIQFLFEDDAGKRSYAANQKGELLRILSTGEARALYILNIMFEVHTRRKSSRKTLFIFDDIADSFDYKNKFAIIDYLDDIVKRKGTNFIVIILTHNFDFLRTIESRKICNADQCNMAFKDNGEIKLTDFKHSNIQNPFLKWHTRINEPIIQIAYIPFLRNLIEYMQGRKNSDGTDNKKYQTLTNILHYKDITEELLLQEYKQVFNQVLSHLPFPEIDSQTKILDYILDTADECLRAPSGINLEHKIVLSIATRICAERYIVKEIRKSDPDYVIKKQMGYLLQDFKERFNNMTDHILLLSRVCLITPSNIHINSFMYEPILDMGFDELKELYVQVKKI